MPRLTMWKPTKSNNYYYIDNMIRQQYIIGGVAMIVHKYRGPQNTDNSDDASMPNYIAKNGKIDELSVQDVLLGENRDRVYEHDVYELRGQYNVSDNDFDLSQFGLFLTNDMLFMTTHLNEMVSVMGRKLMNGDVIELPHLLDDLALDASAPPIPKFYVVQDASRGGDGFSPTWWHHIWRVKLSPLTDSKEFSNILGQGAGSLQSIISDFDRTIEITDQTLEYAQTNNPNNTKDTSHMFGEPIPESGFDWEGNVPSGASFPLQANEGDFFIRNDFQPPRLFVRRGTIWQRRYDNIDTTTWEDKTFNGAEFINNVNTTVVDNVESPERVPLTKANLPRDKK